MKITIFSSVSKRPSGVNRNLIEYGNYLSSKKHKVSVIKAVNRGFANSQMDEAERKLREILYLFSGRRIRYIKKLPWIDINCPVKIIPSISERYLEPSDIILFSFEYHLPSIEKLSRKYGKKVMRVCNVFFAEKVNHIPENIFLIANSTLVKELLEERLKREVFLLVNSINTKIFNNQFQRKEVKSIGMFFYNKKPVHKGMEDGFWVIEQLHKKYPDLKFQIVGEWKEKWIPSFIKFFKGNRLENLINFYRTTDIFIYPSKNDACPNPPMEAMACKCAVVTTNVGGVSDYTISGETAIVVKPGDREGILKGVVSLIENNDFFKNISNGGYKKIQQFSVENQGEKLEKILYTIIKK